MGGVGTFCCRLQRNCLQLQKASLSPFHPLQVLCPAALQLLCFHSQHWALECLIFTEFQSFSFLVLQDLIYPVQFRPKTGGYGHDATEGMAHVETNIKKRANLSLTNFKFSLLENRPKAFLGWLCFHWLLSTPHWFVSC